MDVVLQAAIIGLLQGLTEFIPVSSSAHLELAPWIFGWEEDELIGSLAFDVFLHLGTLVALLVYFWRDWIRYIRAGWASLRERSLGHGPGPPDRVAAARGDDPGGGHRLRAGGLHRRDLPRRQRRRAPGDRRLPGGRRDPAVARRPLRAPHARARADRTRRAALTIGFSQALALLPGISRSGATLTTGLALGLTRESAARFSFLLATPITLGAGLYGSRRLLTESHTGVEWLAIAVGFAVAAISGLIAIGFLLAWLRRRSVAVFSLYRIGFAALIVVLVFIGH